MRKENKNLTGNGGKGEGGGGESRVQNSPKAFGELIICEKRWPNVEEKLISIDL